jgi:hypothetical protein
MSVDTTTASLTPLLDTLGFSGIMAGFLIGFCYSTTRENNTVVAGDFYMAAVWLHRI